MIRISQRDKFGERYSRQREPLVHSSRRVREAGNRMGTWAREVRANLRKAWNAWKRVRTNSVGM